MRKKQGFTLIELLVVVAIIATLIALLMPSLANARNQAKAVACMSNLKQMGIAVQMYAQEYNGIIPMADNTKSNPSSGESWPNNLWMTKLQPYLENRQFIGSRATESNLIRSYTGTFLCPGKWDFNINGPTGVQQISYAFNVFNPFQTTNDTYQKLNNLNVMVAVISDTREGYPRLRSSTYLYAQSVGGVVLRPFPHSYGHNMLFPNGDVQQVREQGVNWDLTLKR